MSGDHDSEVQYLAHILQDYGKPALVFLRVLTWEQPLSWAIIFAFSSTSYVFLHNLSIRAFAILGLVLLWLDFYCSQNKAKILELTHEEKEELSYLCSRFMRIIDKVKAAIRKILILREDNPTYVFRQICIISSVGIVLSLCVDNLLLAYLTELSLLVMMSVYIPQLASP